MRHYELEHSPIDEVAESLGDLGPPTLANLRSVISALLTQISGSEKRFQAEGTAKLR
jgi:hypothetical protein